MDVLVDDPHLQCGYVVKGATSIKRAVERVLAQDKTYSPFDENSVIGVEKYSEELSPAGVDRARRGDYVVVQLAE